MMITRRRIRSRSLADARLNEKVRIRDICFDVIRQRCWTAGLRVGDTVRVAKQTAHELVLSIEGRTPVTLDRFFACFVEVGAPASAPCAVPASPIDPLPAYEYAAPAASDTR